MADLFPYASLAYERVSAEFVEFLTAVAEGRRRNRESKPQSECDSKGLRIEACRELAVWRKRE